MGLGYEFKGGSGSYHEVSDNIDMAKETFPYSNGYFGEAGTSKRVRIIYSDDPGETGKKFYNAIAFGGIEKPLENGKGSITKMADGTIITFRPTTKSDNNPGVDINISKSNGTSGIKQQKIHFERRKK